MILNWNLFWMFIILNVINVIIQTIKSLCTIKGNKWVASIVNAVAYGLYTIVLVYMVCDLPLWLKVVVVGGANLIGVFVVKLIEEKSRKDKLWKVEATIPTVYRPAVNERLNDIPHSYIDIGKRTIFNCYCATQKETSIVKNVMNAYDAKYFVSESKTL